MLGDVDSLAVSDVELKEELLLDNSLLDGRFVANCRTDDPRFSFMQCSSNKSNYLNPGRGIKWTDKLINL